MNTDTSRLEFLIKNQLIVTFAYNKYVVTDVNCYPVTGREYSDPRKAIDDSIRHGFKQLRKTTRSKS